MTSTHSPWLAEYDDFRHVRSCAIVHCLPDQQVVEGECVPGYLTAASCARLHAVRVADADDECGRGLTVVAAVSTRWECERTRSRRKVIWAELAI